MLQQARACLPPPPPSHATCLLTHSHAFSCLLMPPQCHLNATCFLMPSHATYACRPRPMPWSSRAPTPRAPSPPSSSTSFVTILKASQSIRMHMRALALTLHPMHHYYVLSLSSGNDQNAISGFLAILADEVEARPSVLSPAHATLLRYLFAILQYLVPFLFSPHPTIRIACPPSCEPPLFT